MSLTDLSSSLSYYDIQNSDKQTFRKVVDQLCKQADHANNNTTTANSGSSQSKRQRLSQDSAYGTQASQKDWPGVSGTVMKLVLEDFMCHEHLEIDFNSEVNFIVGQNGSGKSAVLTALVVALGGSAATTGRGTSFQSFIRKNTHRARVSCHIYNGGPIAYKQQEYGHTIIVVRVIREAGTSVELRNSRGVKKSGRREDLENMTRTLGIQVDNPISVLDQNTARHFLNQSKAEKKFELFMRATNLETIQAKYGEIALSANKNKIEIRNKEKQIEENSVELKEAKKRHDLFANLSKDRAKKDTLQHEYLWAVARDGRLALKDTTAKLEKVEEECERLHRTVNSGEVEESIIQQIEAFKKETESMDVKEQEVEEEMNSLKVQGRDLVHKIQQFKSEEKELKRVISVGEEEIMAYQAEIEKQQSKMQPDYLEIRREQQEKAESLQQFLNQKFSEERQKKSESEQLRISLNSDLEAAQRLKMNKRARDEEIRQAQRELQGLESQKSNLAVYGPYMPELVNRVEAAFKAGKFQKKPVGPIGAYIKVREAKWTLAVEAALGGRLLSFAVDNKNDEKVLQEIIRQVARRGGPSIAVTKFLNQVHNTSSGAAQSDKYSHILDMLEISNPVAANLLIDLCHVETTLLISSDDECHHLLSEQRRVPVNCAKAYTLKGDQYFPAPNYKTYAGNLRNARYLQASREDVIRETRNRIEQLRQNVDNEEQQMQELAAAEQSKRAQIRIINGEIQHLKEQCLEVQAKLEQLRDQEQPDLNTVSSLKKEVDEKEGKLAKTRSSLEAIPSKMEELKLKLAEAKENIAELNKKAAAIRAEKDPIRLRVQKLQEDQRELHTAQNSKKKKLDQAKKNVAQLTKEKEVLSDSYQKALDEAEKYQNHVRAQAEGGGEPFESLAETERSAQRIEQELRSLQRKLDSVERTLEDNEQNVSKDYHEKLQKYNATKTYLDALKKNVDLLTNVLRTRKSLYHTQKQLMCAVVSHQFTRVLRYRGCTGSLAFDAENKTLNIHVGPMDGSDRAGLGTSSLSGGERSYTTMAFVIALWNVTELPFYFMDEFDVFMDVVNRKIVLDLMLRFAKMKNMYQFGFLTPLDTAAVQIEDGVTIHKMRAPRENQNDA